MLDQSTFMETLRAVAEIRRTSAEPLLREDILRYFDEMELTEEHLEMIWQYMQLPPEVQTAQPEEEKETETEEEKPREPAEDEAEEENVYFQMYLEELNAIEEMSEPEMQAAYEKLLAGDAAVISDICESWLSSIAQLAVPYAEQGANLEDVIQEGNMGLLLKLSELCGAGTVPAIDAILQGAVSAAMTAYTEEMMETQVEDMLVKEQK